jgi:hypothetical protein
VICKKAANLFGANTTRDGQLVKDKYWLGEDGFEVQQQNSMTFFYKAPPVQDMPPRINVYHPDDWEKNIEDRRIIGSFKYSVRSFKTDQFNVCPDCHEDRMDWPEGYEHDCVDAGPANPSGRRHTQKVKYGERRKLGFKGYKKRKREASQTADKKEADNMEFIPVKNSKKKKMPRDPLFNMEELSKTNPGANKTQLVAAVNSLMQTELIELGKRSVEERDSPPLKKTHAEASSSNLELASPNPYQNLALTELTQEPQPQSKTPMVDLAKSKSDTNVDSTESLM